MNRVIAMKTERGFTLVEVLLSIVILFIIGIVVFEFFVFSQKTTVNNHNKLVAVNIAQAVLERVKSSAYTIEDTFPKQYSKDSCSPTDAACLDNYIVHINNEDYFIVIEVGNEYEMGLHFVDVYVKEKSDKVLGHVRGLVEI